MEGFDLEILKDRCSASIKDFHEEGVVTKTQHGVHIYKDNGASVLAVAHLDTVLGDFSWRHKEKRKKIFCPQLDDRLGAWVILDVLPKRGLKYDVLLTEGEETGRSTAQFFKPPEGKKYNWIFSFDRRGIDVVCYQYKTKELDKLITDAGFIVGSGSMSDISYMGGLGVKGINFGVGYRNEHQRDCHFDIPDCESQISKFEKFFYRNSTTLLTHTDPPKSVYNQGWQEGWDGWRGQYKAQEPWRGNVGHRTHVGKKKLHFAYLKCDPTIVLVLDDREIIVPMSRLATELTLSEYESIFQYGVAEIDLPLMLTEGLLEEVFGDEKIKVETGV
jgi:hypothetical protein